MGLVSVFVFLTVVVCSSDASDAEFNLQEDIFEKYNKFARPVKKDNETLVVYIRLKLSQIIDVGMNCFCLVESLHERDQIVTSNMWLQQEWFDNKLQWNPRDYDGIKHTMIAANEIWLPDIVLYNNADGNYQIALMTQSTKATVWYNGRVVWTPAAIFKSQCNMNLEFFPFDIQRCTLKFGAWSYDGYQVDLIHWKNNQVNITYNSKGQKIWVVSNGIDFQNFHESGQWDVLSGVGTRHAVVYPCCAAPFIDITYGLVLRRKPLFYTINLIVPCVGISAMTVFTFYVPGHCSQKVTLCISELVALTVFFILLVELIPPTSLVIPLAGKYMLFTLFLVAASICLSVLVLAFHQAPLTTTKILSPKGWIRRWLLSRLPRILGMDPLQNPCYQTASINFKNAGYDTTENLNGYKSQENPREIAMDSTKSKIDIPVLKTLSKGRVMADRSVPRYSKVAPKRPVMEFFNETASLLRDIDKAKATEIKNSKTTDKCEATAMPKRVDKELNLIQFQLEYISHGVNFISETLQRHEFEEQIMAEWKYVAMVLDRIFLYAFGIIYLVGTYILLSAPSYKIPQ